MIKLGWCQIVKNESHVIERCLDSLKPIIDYICVVDTGSTDNTIELIKNWGKTNNVETDVYERPFDNFEASRNFAMEMAEKRPDIDYFMWLDADEILHVDLQKFDKQKLDKELYMMPTFIGRQAYTRNELWKNTKGLFRWYGVVHEFITPTKPNITSGVLEGLNVEVKMEGASWKGDIHMKYYNHAAELEKYIITNQDPRWIFYVAQSWNDAACVPNNPQENHQRLKRALHYYKRRVEIPVGYHEERYYAQYRAALIQLMLGHPFSTVHQELLKAYHIDPLRGESIKTIIDYYGQRGEYPLAYIYSKFGVNTFHGKNPFPNRLLFIDKVLYDFVFLETHILTCFQLGYKEETLYYHNMLNELIKTKPDLFTDVDLNRINNVAVNIKQRWA